MNTILTKGIELIKNAEPIQALESIQEIFEKDNIHYCKSTEWENISNERNLSFA